MTDFEREDMELAAVMGGRFIDETKEHTEEPAAEPVAKPIPEKYNIPVKNVPEKEKAVNAPWEPVKPMPNFKKKLEKVTKDVGLYAVLSLILFWWQQTGRIDYDTAWYALLLCVGMVFFSIGKNCRGGEK